MLRAVFRSLHDHVSTVSAVRSAYPAAWKATLRRAVGLRRDGFALEESLQAGLLDPASAPHTEAVSTRARHTAQELANPTPARVMADDKVVFDRLCRAAGLPVPELLALLWTPDAGRPVAIEMAGWSRMLEALEGEVVLKPARGAKGAHVRAATRSGAHFAMDSGERLRPVELTGWMWGSGVGTWLVQRRLHDHPDVAAMAPSRALQTLRITTLMEAGGIEVPVIYWRLAPGDRVVDNFGAGGGNLVATVGEDGRVAAVVGAGDAGLEDAVARTPDGTPLVGLAVPMIHDAVDLARRAAEVMAPLRTVGFDIGLTPDGPVLIEANCWWDLLPGVPARALFNRVLASAEMAAGPPPPG